MNGKIGLLTILALIAAAGLGFPQAAHATGTTYYVSQSSGDDAHDGLAAAWDGAHGPWKTLARASTVTWSPGDELLLKCGEIWDETLTLRGDGTAASPVTVASYGTGERPYIRRAVGGGTECIVIDKAAGYRFSDLELGQAEHGIHIVLDAQAKSDYDYFRFENLFFHDINCILAGSTYNTGDWGYALWFDGSAVPRNITIINCIGLRTLAFSNNGRKGNVVFDRNTITHGSLNQVGQSHSADFDITNSVFVYNYPWRYDKWGTTQVIAGFLDGGPGIRYDVTNCEFGWAGDYPGSPDGCGYDFEVPTNGVFFQNNFIHNSYGEAVLFMSNYKHDNLVFDNNIFLNNVRFSPRWDCNINLPMNLTGSGTISNNKFILWPGKKAFSDKPTCFTYVNNDEDTTGSFVAMPLVSRIESDGGARTYSLTSATPGATIRYTTDAGMPDASSPVYDGPVRLERSGVLNVKAFKDGYYPSYVNSLAVELRQSEGGGPAAWWKLDERLGAAAEDSAGNNDGLITGATRTEGPRGRALEFDGVDDTVTFNNASLAALSGDFTIAFWAAPEATRTLTPEVGSGMGLPGVAWLKLDEGSGATVADAMGAAAGTIDGCAWTTGKFGAGLDFNGTSDSVALNTANFNKIADTFTISFWAQTDALRAITPEANSGISGIGDQRYALLPIPSSGDNEAGAGVSVGANGVSVFEHAANYLPSLLVANRAKLLTGWNLITVVYQNKQPTLYINGVFEKTGLRSNRTVHPNFNLGGSDYGWFEGQLDDVRVYPRALTVAEVAELATGGPEPSVAWSLDPTAGTTGLPYALGPTSRGGGPDAGHAGVGVAVGTNGVSVCEASDLYLPSLLIDNLPLAGWNHIAVVYRDSQPILYLNGVFEKAGCHSEKIVHPVFNLGGGGDLGRYDGKLDDVRVYDHALTDAEVQVLANPGGVNYSRNWKLYK